MAASCRSAFATRHSKRVVPRGVACHLEVNEFHECVPGLHCDGRRSCPEECVEYVPTETSAPGPVRLGSRRPNRRRMHGKTCGRRKLHARKSLVRRFFSGVQRGDAEVRPDAHGTDWRAVQRRRVCKVSHSCDVW